MRSFDRPISKLGDDKINRRLCPGCQRLGRKEKRMKKLLVGGQAGKFTLRFERLSGSRHSRVTTSCECALSRKGEIPAVQL